MSDRLISEKMAIDGLRDYLVGKRCPDDGTLTCRLIENEVINKLPTAEPHSINLTQGQSSDMISRQAAINAIDECYCGGEDSCGERWIYQENAVEAIQMIEPMPTDPQKRKRGKWIHDGFDHPHGIDWCHCSICGNREDMKSVYTNVHIYPFCPNCGARMEVDT